MADKNTPVQKDTSKKDPLKKGQTIVNPRPQKVKPKK
jgi:hypothetical protein